MLSGFNSLDEFIRAVNVQEWPKKVRPWLARRLDPEGYAERQLLRRATDRLERELQVERRDNHSPALYSGSGLRAYLCSIEQADDPVMVIRMDLNGFKNVNDRHGHETGNAYLAAFGDRLAATIRERDVVGRFVAEAQGAREQGDEYFVVLRGVPEKDTDATARRILERMTKDRIAVPGSDGQMLSVGVSVSAGAALYKKSQHDLIDIIRGADNAMYAAKPENSRDVYPDSNDYTLRMAQPQDL